MQVDVQVNVSDVLRVMADRLPNAKTDESFNKIAEVLYNLIGISDPTQQRLTVMEQLLATLKDQISGEIMATVAEFNAVLSEIQTGLAAVIEKVAELENNAGITATDEASVLTQLQGVSDALKAVVAPEPPAEEPPAEA